MLWIVLSCKRNWNCSEQKGYSSKPVAAFDCKETAFHWASVNLSCDGNSVWWEIEQVEFIDSYARHVSRDGIKAAK